MIRIDEYVADGVSPFRRWFDDLDAQAAAFVTTAIERLAEGNVSNVRSIGEGAAELKINRGPDIASTSGGTAKRWCRASSLAGLQEAQALEHDPEGWKIVLNQEA